MWKMTGGMLNWGAIVLEHFEECGCQSGLRLMCIYDLLVENRNRRQVKIKSMGVSLARNLFKTEQNKSITCERI